MKEEQPHVPLTWQQILDTLCVWLLLLFLSGVLVLLVYWIAMGDIQAG